MQINAIFDQAISSLPTGFVTAVNWVVNYFDTLFTNNVTLNINVGYGEVAGSSLGGALGASQANYLPVNYTTARSTLIAENAPGASTLPTTSPVPGSLYVPQAEAKALGISSGASSDGSVGFSSSVSWSYTPNVTPAAGAYYFIGTLEHEITEIMGRVSLIDMAPSFYALGDLYRFTSTGARGLTTGGAGSLAYFSVDGGQTLLRSWNNNPSNGDVGDWYGSGAPGADMANDYGSTGVISAFSTVDLTLMEALGWTTASGPAAPTIASFTPDSGVAGDHITNATTLTLSGTATASSTVTVYDGATMLGTATADTSGNWSYTTGTLTNGSHSFTATDTVSGSTSTASTALSITVDTTAPPAPIVASFSTDSGTVGDHITNDNTITLTGTAEANATVKVYDGATLLGTVTANGSGAWSYTTAALSDATHSFTATATDAAGNLSAASAALSVTIDTAAPVAPAIASFSADSGTVGDHITNDNTLALTGTAEANSTVKIYDGATLLGSVTANGTGGWSYTTAALTDGAHSLTATATDAAGNTGAASSALAVTIDTAAPSVSQTTSSPVSGVEYPGNTITLTVQLSEVVTVAGTPTLTLNDGGTASFVSGSGTNTLTFSYTVGASDSTVSGLAITAVNLPNGASVSDAAGNAANLSGALVTFPNLQIDPPNAPAIVSFSPDSGAVGDGITNANTLTLTGTAAANSTVTVYDGTTLLGTANADASGAWSFTAGTLANGGHSFTATETVSGVTSAASVALNVTVDTAAPTAPAITTFSTDSGTLGDHITNDNTLTLTGTAEANSTVKVYDGATLLGSATANGSGAWTYTTAALANGAHSLTATATDAAGNTGVPSSALAVSIDTTAPTAPTIASFSTDSGVVGDNITNDNTLTLNGTAEANATVKIYDGATLLGSVAANAGGAWSYTTAALANGAHSLTATATDAAGNTGITSAALGITIDATAPVAPTIASFSADSGVVGDGITNVNVLTLTGAAEANSTVKIYDGATLLANVTANGTGVWSYTTATLTDGAHNFSATATDAAGNTGVASAAFNVTIDTVAPVTPTISSFSSDSGVVGDHITNDTLLTFTGTAEANSVITVYDGSTIIGTTTANASGTWTFDPTNSQEPNDIVGTVATRGLGHGHRHHPKLAAASSSTETAGSDFRESFGFSAAPLSDGVHSFSVTSTDAAGNVSAASSPLSVTIDAAAPVAPTISSFSTDSGTAGDGITNDNTLTLTGTAEANATVKVYDGATLLGSATANASGAWSFTTGTLSNGAHSLTATATDAAGNTGVPSIALAVTVDTVAPVAPTIASFSPDTGVVGDKITDINTLTLTGTAEANATVKVYDGATLLGSVTANGTGAWSYTTAALANGVHSLTATATDAAGNTGVASAALAVTVDTVAPVAPTIASFSTDSGVAGDNITNDNTLTLTGTAEANATVKVYDGATLLGSAVASGTGAWTYTTAALANGTHSFTATATDAAGNAGVASAALAVTIDTTAPVAPAIVSFSTDSGVAGDNITNDSTLTLTGTAEANATVKVYDGATLLGSATANGSGAWSFTTGILANGTHSLTATATDAAGNTGVASTALAVTVDTVAPVAPIIASFSTDSGVAGDHITNDNTLTLTGTAEANATVKVFDGATLLGSVTASGTGAWTYTTAALANGVHSLTATASDAAGNTGVASAALAVTIDTTAPVAPTIASFSTDSGVAGDNITNDNTLTLTGSAEANATVKIYDGATQLGSVVASSTGAWTYTTAALATGGHSLTATATDAAGNTGVASTTLAVTIDTTAPVAPTIASFSTDSGVAGDHITNDSTLTLTGTAEANATVKVYDGATLLGSVLASGTGAWTYTTAALANGAHSLTATATDVAGNTGVASAALAVTVDTVAPVAPSISSFSPDSATLGDHITNASVLTLNGTAEANSTVKIYDGATLLGSAAANGSGAWSFSPSALSDGTHSLTATATDAAGNTGAVSTALSVTVDTTAPVAPTITSFTPDSGTLGDGITNSSTLTLAGTAEANSTVKVYDGATLLGTVAANGSGAWSFSTGTLANGAHNVTATATDAAGNASTPSSPMTVTVDTHVPAVSESLFSDTGTSSTDKVTSNATLTGLGDANALVHFTVDGTAVAATATANSSGIWTFTPTGLADGVHTIVASETDTAGTTGTSTITLTLDATSPLVSGTTSTPSSGVEFPGNTVTLTLNLSETVTVTGIPTLTLNSGGTATYSSGSGTNALVFTYTVSTNDSTVPALGITAVNLPNGASIKDAAGNVANLSGAVSSFPALQIDPPGAPSILSIAPDTGAVGDGITSANVLTLTGSAEANATVKIYDGATLLGTAAVDAAGAWSFTTATLASGSHSFTATETVSGATGATSAALSVTVDSVAPVAPTITTFSPDTGLVGDKITDANTLILTGKAEANATVKVYDGATLLGSVLASSTGAWTYTTGALANGSHSLTATATDAAGNTGVASTALSVTVDTTAPVAPTIASFSTDSGVAGDHITNDNTLTLTGSAEANATVKVYDGATLLGSVLTSSTGAWTYTTAALANGVHSLTATATDAAGNTGVASAALAVTIDTTAPVAPTIASFSTDSGVAGDHITNDNTLTLTGSAEANATVKVYDGATLLGSVLASSTGAWTYTTAALANGSHSLTATATDAAGNTGVASAALAVTIDTTAPVAPTIASFSTDSGVAGDHITNDNTLALTGKAEANATVKVYDGATLLGSVLASSTGAWTYTTAALANGSHSLTATATDAAGNTGVASAALAVTIDTTAPVAPTIASFSTDSGVAGDHITNDNTLTLTGSAEANATVKVYNGATLLGNATANASGAWSYTTGALANGVHSLTATATDAAGNTGVASAALAVTIDTTAPVAPTIASFSTDSGVAGDHITNDNTLTLTGSAEANATVKVYDGATLLGSVLASSTGAWTYTTAALANGSHSLTATATDAAGNTGVASAALAVTIDTTAPVAPTIASFSTDSGVAGDHITNDNTLALTGKAEANATVKVYDGATLLGSVLASSTGAWTYTTAALANGSHSLTATATDAAGNTGVASAALAVTIDTTAPVAPTIASFSTDSGVAGDHITNDNTLTLTGSAEANATVKVYNGATLLGNATANASGAWSYTTGALANGVHSLTATATDAAGNTGVASAALAVTIDTTAPVAPTIASFSTDSGVAGDHITNDNTLTLTGSAEANATVKVYDGATLLGSVLASSTGAWTYTTAALANGSHSLTATATDAAGNISTSSSGSSLAATAPGLNVTIDTVAPNAPAITGSAIANLNEVALTGTAEANATVKVYDGATLLGNATANASGAWNYTTGTLANGGHSLTATTTDTAGNTSLVSSPLDVTVDTSLSSIAVNVTSYMWSGRGLGYLTGTSEPGSTVSVYDDNSGANLGKATTSSNGTWSLLMGNVTNSFHSFLADAIDAAGHTGSVNIVIGTTGNDKINTTAANETLLGNGGIDTFVFPASTGRDTIADFHASSDVLQLNHNAFATLADVLSHTAQVGSDVVIIADASNSITLHNTLISQLTNHNIHIV